MLAAARAASTGAARLVRVWLRQLRCSAAVWLRQLRCSAAVWLRQLRCSAVWLRQLRCVAEEATLFLRARVERASRAARHTAGALRWVSHRV